MVENGGMTAEGAARKADRDHERLLPDGLGTPGHAHLAVEHADGGAVGALWLGELGRGEGAVAFVLGVEIEPEHRGRGYGRRGLELAEEEAKARGRRRLELNVCGGSEVARRLYRSLGYEELAVSMGKTLE